MSRGADDIREERLRQIAVEGYVAEHDDTHVDGMIAMVAAELAFAHTAPMRMHKWSDPWGLLEKHRSTRRRLVIAGALLAAEIDRLDRLATKESQP